MTCFANSSWTSQRTKSRSKVRYHSSCRSKRTQSKASILGCSNSCKIKTVRAVDCAPSLTWALHPRIRDLQPRLRETLSKCLLQPLHYYDRQYLPTNIIPDTVHTQITIKATNDHVISPISGDMGCQDRRDIPDHAGHPSLRNDLDKKHNKIKTITRNNSITFTSLINTYLRTSPYNLILRWTAVVTTRFLCAQQNKINHRRDTSSTRSSCTTSTTTARQHGPRTAGTTGTTAATAGSPSTSGSSSIHPGTRTSTCSLGLRRPKHGSDGNQTIQQGHLTARREVRR